MKLSQKSPFYKALIVLSTFLFFTSFISTPGSVIKANRSAQLADDLKAGNFSGLNENSKRTLLNMQGYDPVDSDTIDSSILLDGSTPDFSHIIDKNRIETFTIKMPQLDDRKRTIIVYLPSDYGSGDTSYPVMYLQDAQNVFKHYDATRKDYYLNETLYEFYAEDFKGEVIVVGVESDFDHIWDEYSPWVNDDVYKWKDPNYVEQVEGGEGDNYLNFLIQTLKPEIDQRYRTLMDQKNTAIGGSGMGGLISLYAGLTRPDVYSKVLAMSPDIWFAESGGTWLSNNQIIDLISNKGVPKDVSFSLDVGAEERRTDLEVHPDVLDKNGKSISYAQTYLEGTQALVNALIHGGLPVSDIQGGLQNPMEWTEGFVYPSDWQPAEEDQTTFTTFTIYFPLVFRAAVPPTITSADHTNFPIGGSGSFTVTATGYPLPAITYSGALPGNVTLVDHGDGTATLSGSPAVGNYQFVLIASNGFLPNAQQTFTLTVSQAPAITSANHTTFTVGSAGSFTVTTTGNPVPGITYTGTLPTGVSFTNNGNGTATLNGTPSTNGTYNLTITASNGVNPDATQSFTLYVITGCPDSNSCLLTFEISMQPYLNRTRRIWVYLPENYNAGGIYYPVIYLMDALHQFNPYGSSTYEEDWRTDEKLDSLYSPPSFDGVIAVGITHHTTTFRWSEYIRWTQYNMDNWVDDGSEVVVGEGDAFINFIVNVLKPNIDTKYRTLTDRANTAIGGASRGAFLSISAALQYPGTFSKVMAMSPAVWLAEGGVQTDHPIWLSNNRLLTKINSYTLRRDVKFYLYVGGEEASTGEPYPLVYRSTDDEKITYPEAYKEGAVAVYSALNNKGFAKVWEYNAVGTHHATYWRQYFQDVLEAFGFY